MSASKVNSKLSAKVLNIFEDWLGDLYKQMKLQIFKQSFNNGTFNTLKGRYFR